MENENILTTALENGKKPFVLDAGTKETILCIPAEDGTWDIQTHNFTGKPFTIKGSRTFTTVDSFLDYLNRYKTEATNIYLEVDNKYSNVRLVAIINDSLPDKPDCGDFRVYYSPQRTQMSKEWTEKNDVRFDQQEFCRFLEQQAKTIVSSSPDNPSLNLPSSAEVLDFCSNMEYKEDFIFQSSINEQDGRMSFVLKSKEKDNESRIKAFKEFAIAYTPFVGGDSFFVKAFLKFRINKETGALILWYELQNMDLVLEKAIESIKQKLHENVGTTPIYYATEPLKASLL